MAALLLALVVLVVYGGINLVVADDSPESSKDGAARHAVRTLNVSEIRQVVPDLTSMPQGWARSRPVTAGRTVDDECSSAEAMFNTAYGRTSAGTVVHAFFNVWSCYSATESAKVFEEKRSAYYAEKLKVRGISLPELGDQRAALTYYNIDLDETSAVALLRVGTVLIELEYQPVLNDDPEWNTEFEQLVSTVATRAQQVQNG